MYYGPNNKFLLFLNCGTIFYNLITKPNTVWQNISCYLIIYKILKNVNLQLTIENKGGRPP